MGAPKGNKFAINNAGGRPTKYSSFDEIISLSQEYLETVKDEYEWVDTKKDGKDNTIQKERVVKVSLPSIAGLAKRLDVSRETIYAWKKENKEFSDIADKILTAQEERLLSGGLSNTYNAMISKLILSARHEYREKTDMTSNGKELDRVVKIEIINPE